MMPDNNASISDRPLRVWHLTTELSNIGGAERVNFELFRLIRAHGIEPVVICAYRPGDLGQQLEAQGVRIESGIATWRHDPRALGRLRRLAHEVPPDVVFFTDNAFAMFWASVLRRTGTVPHLVLASHVSRSLKFPTDLAYRFVLGQLDRLIVLTPQLADYWRHKAPRTGPILSVIPNGIDSEKFKPPGDRAAMRRSLGLPEDRLLIGTVAHLKPVKNLELFIEVARRLTESGIDADYVLVGDGPERGRLEALARSRGLADRCRFAGMTSDPAPWQQCFDIGLLTSHSEAMPLMVIEANSCGVPVVSTEVGGLGDVIRPGQTGFLTPPGDLEGLTRHVLTLAQDEGARQRMGSAARAEVLSRFSLEAMVSAYAKVFCVVAHS